jgi:undecaprenyl-diphosphatase
MASIPAGIVGLLLADYFEAELSTPVWVSFNLFITAGLLTYGEWWMRSETKPIDALESEVNTPIKTVDSLNLSLADAIIVGMAQALAILPGISRSGSTIAIGMARGLGRQAATRFSFLLATPIILAAGFKESLDLVLGNTSMPENMTVVLLLGLVSSAGVGYASIAGLLRLIRHVGFYGFAVYCVVFGMLSLGAILVRG